MRQTSTFVRIVIREFLDDRLALRAMALTFATLLSMIPLLAISFTMFKLFGGGDWFLEMLTPFLENNLAPGASPAVVARLQRMIETFGGATAGGIGLLLLLLGVYGIFTAIESTFNLIWGVNSRAGSLHRLPLYWGLVTIIPILVVSSLAITTYIKALPLVSEFAQRTSIFAAAYSRLLPTMLVMLSLFLLYRFLPSTKVRTTAALAGAVLASMAYEGIKLLFILYAGKLMQYDVLYGSLAIGPLLMIWVNLSWVVVLAGVEVCFVTQHYQVLLQKRKHVQLSRPQQDVLGLLILTEVTRAFRGERNPVEVNEWTREFGAPPQVVSRLIERFKAHNILKTVGRGDVELLLTRDPESIKISEIRRILSGEAAEEFDEPENEQWLHLRQYYSKGTTSATDQEDRTLADLVNSVRSD
ncbi:YihY/virulence factor BrkB family protein [Calditrichota bacterium]